MANSLWLDHEFPYHQEAADRLAQYYYASTFHGDLGTEVVDQQLREWLNANTGGLLKEQANNVKLNPEAVFALASTIYFTAGWTDEFSEEHTYNETFHAPTGDIQTPFMHQTRRDTYYRGTNFGAICLRLGDSNQMWLILPDEGFTTEDILKSDEYLQLTLDPGSQLYGIEYEIHLSLPKFDVVQQQDLIGSMRQLGITDVFNSAASDFSPISSMKNLFISQINHAARVTIDEEGCTAAAFTVIMSEGTGAPSEVEELYFTLDRPFLFLVTSRDHLPMFAGIVKQP
jgi:serpin B